MSNMNHSLEDIEAKVPRHNYGAGEMFWKRKHGFQTLNKSEQLPLYPRTPTANGVSIPILSPTNTSAGQEPARKKKVDFKQIYHDMTKDWELRRKLGRHFKARSQGI